MQGIVPKGLQKPGARGVSYRRRKATVSQMTSIDVIRGAASFSVTSIDVIRGQRVNTITMVSMETKFVSQDSILDKLSEKVSLSRF